MGKFRPDRNNSRENRFEGRDRDSRDSHKKKPLEMHDVTCDKCGKQTEVPFKPKGNKPVYCRDCFQRPDSGQRNPPERANENTSTQLTEINRKLDKIINSLKI